MTATRFRLATDGLAKDFPVDFLGYIPTIKKHRKTGYWIRLRPGQRLFWRRALPLCVKCEEQLHRCACRKR